MAFLRKCLRRQAPRMRLQRGISPPLKNPQLSEGGWDTNQYKEVNVKNKKLSIRISEADWQRFHEKADQANMTLTEYITDCCLGKQIVVIDGLDEVIRQQKAIGRNLNQVTTLANMGRVKAVYLQELTEAYTSVSSLLSDILKRKRW